MAATKKHLTLKQRIATWTKTKARRAADVTRRTKQLAHARARMVASRNKPSHAADVKSAQAAKSRLAASKKALTDATAALTKLRKQAQPPLRERAYRVAASLVGVMEQGGNNRGPVVSKIIRENGGMVGEPWCGDFDAYCYRHAGSKAVNRSWAAVVLLGRVAGVVRTSKPQRGDIVRFNFDHTGLFVKWVGNGYFETIEGNTGATGAVSDSKTGGDGVYRKRRHVSQVTDFRRVTR